MNILVVFDGFDEREVVFLAGAEGIAVGGGSLVRAIAYAGAESKSFGFGVETFGFIEKDIIIVLFGLIEIGFEAFEVIVNEEINKWGVGYDVNFD